MRAVVVVVGLSLLGCRGTDECGGAGTVIVELGLDGSSPFDDYREGDGIPVEENDEGELGVYLGVRTHGLDTRSPVTLTVDLEAGGYLRQLLADVDLVCDADGYGRVRAFAGLPQGLIDAGDPLVDEPLFLQAEAIDATDELAVGEDLLLSIDSAP